MGSKINLIEGIIVTPLKQIEDERGAVFHVMKDDSPQFKKFGEVYFSKVNPGVVKAWKYHEKMTQNLSVPFGRLKLVVVDLRKSSTTKNLLNEFILDSKDEYKLISLPPKLWYGFKCLSDNYCLLLNIADLKHDKNESKHQSIDDSNIVYNW